MQDIDKMIRDYLREWQPDDEDYYMTLEKADERYGHQHDGDHVIEIALSGVSNVIRNNSNLLFLATERNGNS